MNPTIMSFKAVSQRAVAELERVIPEEAIQLSPLTYLLPSPEMINQILEKMPQSPKLRESPYIAISLKTKTLRHSGHDKAVQILQSIDYEIV
jgi:hypothetical protein